VDRKDYFTVTDTVAYAVQDASNISNGDYLVITITTVAGASNTPTLLPIGDFQPVNALKMARVVRDKREIVDNAIGCNKNV